MHSRPVCPLTASGRWTGEPGGKSLALITTQRNTGIQTWKPPQPLPLCGIVFVAGARLGSGWLLCPPWATCTPGT